ncbi:carboxymuconolactone decarboxylase family protein [Salibacterium halotolerans]|uniref:Alkylhydroperoxidase AhpD family core domain-containing protein n=1 Tax=Salibacterium halotolerans TaxID=1884432 RepID=A0A1I5QWI5_9BACI|nr:carboxymuconolactone decarboxylase family protein [Salibacterium halotolerans]SFP50411.1 alkylhydroperoxidase AhpD family core domain-containing protein [Salibacterium halotolerans]
MPQQQQGQQGQDQQSSSFIQQALQEYKEGVGIFQEKIPHIARRYNAFTEACFKTGELEAKEKQRMALALSVYAQDEYCIIYHTKGCLDEGSTEKEIMEILGVTAAFGGGAAMSQAVTLVQEAVQELQTDKQMKQ